jgi:hypothetical protein
METDGVAVVASVSDHVAPAGMPNVTALTAFQLPLGSEVFETRQSVTRLVF